MEKPPLPDEIIDAVNAQFPPEERETALALLASYNESWGPADPTRMRREILYLAHGDIAEIPLLLELARRDYRDLLASAEGWRQAKTNTRIRFWDASPIPVSPRADGWLRCPACNQLFTLRSTDSWNGRRHRTCGQRLSLPQAPLSV